MNYDALKEKINGIFKHYNVDIHSYVIMHHEDVVLEHYNEPFNENFLHRMYSSTKSFTGIAIGKLIEEGKIDLDEPISSYFEDKFDMSETHPYVKEVTVRDALMMSTCYCVSAYTPRDKNWLECFFRAKPSHPAGMLWCYDSAGTYALGGLIRHMTGKTILEYLKPVLDEIGFSKEAYMIKGPDGEDWSSSALVATTKDFARFAALLANHGSWNGKQLLPKDYVYAATSAQIANFDDGGEGIGVWNRGYGYQIWILPDNAFFLNGASGQYAIGFPERGLVFACNADTGGYEAAKHIIFEMLWKEILPNFPKEKEVPNGISFEKTVQDDINHVTYVLDENPMNISEITFDFSENSGVMTYHKKGAEKKILFGLGENKKFYFPEKYNGDILFCEEMKREYQCLSRADWVEAHRMVITIKAIDDYIGSLTMSFSFKGDRIGLKMHKSAQFFFDDYAGYTGGKKKTQ